MKQNPSMYQIQSNWDARWSVNHVRKPKTFNLTLIEYAILGVDGDLITVRKYPPIKPKDLPKCMMSLEDYRARGKP